MIKHLVKGLRWLRDAELLQTASSLFAGLSPKNVATGLLIGLVLLTLTLGVKDTYGAWRTAEMAELRSQVTLELNEHTLARFAKHRLDRDSLSLVVAAADSLNGELVAALAIHTKPDTITVVDSTSTDFTETEEGTFRVAELADTTAMGIEIDIRAEAPADQTQPLTVGYTITVPSFRPEIGFVETAEGVFATVAWLNQNFTVESPFYRPVQENLNPLQVQIGSRLLMVGSPNVAQLFHYDVYVQLSYERDSGWNVAVPFGLQPGGTYVGLSFQKTVLKIPSLRSLLPF